MELIILNHQELIYNVNEIGKILFEQFNIKNTISECFLEHKSKIYNVISNLSKELKENNITRVHVNVEMPTRQFGRDIDKLTSEITS